MLKKSLSVTLDSKQVPFNCETVETPQKLRIEVLTSG